MNIKCENFVSAYSPASVKDGAGRLTYIKAMTRSTGESPKCCKIKAGPNATKPAAKCNKSQKTLNLCKKMRRRLPSNIARRCKIKSIKKRQRHTQPVDF